MSWYTTWSYSVLPTPRRKETSRQKQISRKSNLQQKRSEKEVRETKSKIKCEIIRIGTEAGRGERGRVDESRGRLLDGRTDQTEE